MKDRPERGAALLEVLIAVAITAMLAAALAQATRFGLTVVERVQTTTDATTGALISRRKLADLLTRLDPTKADRDSASGDASTFVWHGVAATDVGWRSGVWRLQTSGNEAELSACVELDATDGCEIQDSFAIAGPFAYAAADGVFVSDWPAGPPPHLIRVGDHVFAPRVLGALQ